jgi:hypothetical protein
MATHDYVIANASGSSVRSDLNNALAAIVSNNSSSSEPSTKYAYMLWVDSTNNLIKLRNSANNAWITLFTTAGGLDVDAASNFNEDVIFYGANYNLSWDKSADSLIFADNTKLALGSGSDLQLYHNASASYITNATGSLLIKSNYAYINDADGNNFIRCEDGSYVSLHYDGSKKFDTQSDGIKAYGDYHTNDANKINLGTDDDYSHWHDGSHAYTKNLTGNIYVNTTELNVSNVANNEFLARFIADGACMLYYDNSQKLECQTQGIAIAGTIRSQGTYDNTTSNAANMYVHSSPYDFYRSTSSIKYKDNVTTLTDAEADNILNCRPVTYTSKCTVDNPEDIHYGLIAEEVKDVDLRLVVFEGSEPENVKYDRFIPHLINLVKRLTDKVETLETKVAALEG